MGEVVKRAVVDVPRDRVFKYVADPHNAPRYISSIRKIISGPDDQPKQGTIWRAEATFLGRPAVIDLRLARLQPSEFVTFSIEGEPQATIAIRLVPDREDKRTQVTLTLDVPSVPILFLNALMGGLLEGDLERLKQVLES